MPNLNQIYSLKQKFYQLDGEDRIVKDYLEKNKDDFWLIGRRHLRDNNSWMHNSSKLMKGKNRCTLMINPEDMEKLGLQNNQVVKVKSRVGEVLIPIEMSSDIMPSVVSMPHGYGHHRKGIKMEVAENHPGVSINDLSDEKVIDKLTGNSAFSGVKVKILVLN